MKNLDIELFINKIPKAELHVHIEGTLEPRQMFLFAKRNKVPIKYNSIVNLHKAYNFSNLQSFLNIYYEGVVVLKNEIDFYELTKTYLENAHKENILHTEIFFDPQAHICRGISFSNIVNGINRAQEDAKKKLGISSLLIMCFLRHLDVESAFKTLEESIPFKDKIIGIGLDSSEVGNPPSKFKEVFSKAKALGYLTVAHAGEEGPASYIWEAINDLNVSRIDHGVRAQEDKLLVEELKKKQIPLTVCPLSNLKLGVFKDIKDHNFKTLLDSGLKVTINSDDPAYFGGYVNENFLALHRAFRLSKEEVYKVCKNSFEASFLSSTEKEKILSKLNEFVNNFKSETYCLL